MASNTCCCGACSLRNGVFSLAVLQLVAAFYSFLLVTPIGLPGSQYPVAISVLSGLFYFVVGLAGLWATSKVIYDERNSAEQARRVGIYWWLFLTAFLLLGLLFPIVAEVVAFQNINDDISKAAEGSAKMKQAQQDRDLMIVAAVGQWVVAFPIYCYLLIVVWSFRKQIREGTYQETTFSSAATI
eukprot:TRINITY_DN4563_c0_g1_i1.p2 TRINITY_DN4563_c0_g1~~TRINITY_DN4563_c0_g1_i1.p2  ORF type:complete len:201 (+),score=16.84 TRINITY_DN4563_c0_g1_i1:51-605(+)